MKAPTTLNLSWGTKTNAVRGTVTASREIGAGKTVYCVYCGKPCRVNVGKGISYVTCGRKFRVKN